MSANLISFLSSIRWQDFVDIIIVSFLIYNILSWFRTRRAKVLFQGLLFFMFLYALSQFFQLYTIYWLMQKIITVLLLVVIIVFQPELRQFLEKWGEKTQFNKLFLRDKSKELISIQFIQSLIKAVEHLSEQKIGSLIVIEMTTILEKYRETGVLINAQYSYELLVSLFYARNPLHDGAVILKENRIVAAGCLLPLTDAKLRDRSLGTRHRAALGLAEATDAIVLVTSEETGIISIAKDGMLYRKLNRKKLNEQLLSHLHIDTGEEKDKPQEKFLSLVKRFTSQFLTSKDDNS
jgi:diadenylate cyclase